jgi:hypothetical protein
MAFVDKLRGASAASGRPFADRLAAGGAAGGAAGERVRPVVDPWLEPLERLRGRVGPDGLERVTSGAIFDLLGTSHFGGDTHRVRPLMIALGWRPVVGSRVPGRGYARDATGITPAVRRSTPRCKCGTRPQAEDSC